MFVADISFTPPGEDTALSRTTAVKTVATEAPCVDLNGKQRRELRRKGSNLYDLFQRQAACPLADSARRD